jgi:nitroreductase
MTRAACAGIDHGRLGPTRFVYITDDSRRALADAFASAVVEADETAEERQLAMARERAMAGPCLVSVIARIVDCEDIPSYEQWIAVGAALQNFMLAAASLGFAAKMVSGRRTGSGSLRAFFKLDANEFLVGFVAMGTTSEPARALPRRSPEQVISIV